MNPRLEQIAATLGASLADEFSSSSLFLSPTKVLLPERCWRFRALWASSARQSCWRAIFPVRHRLLSLAIYSFVQLGKDSEAYTLLGITVALAFLFVWCSEWLLRSAKKA